MNVSVCLGEIILLPCDRMWLVIGWDKLKIMASYICVVFMVKILE